MTESVDAMLTACMDGDERAVKKLLRRDPSLANASGFAIGTTALILAAHRGFDAICTRLLDVGADVAARETTSDSIALHWAAEGGHRDVATRLLDAGAHVEAVDTWFGLTPLGWTAVPILMPDVHDDRRGVADDLVARGAVVDPFSAVVHGWLDRLERSRIDDRLGFAGRGRTPLHVAATRCSAEAVQALVALGADVDTPDARGASARALAFVADDAGRAVDASFGGRPLDASARLVTGDVASVHSIDAEERPGLLHFVAEHGRTAAVARLLELGVDPDTEIETLANEQRASTTALLEAIANGHVDATRTLLVSGADPNRSPVATGISPLHAAAAAGHTALVDVLLEHGAARDAVDREHGATPGQWAGFFGHAAIATRLG